MSDTQTAYALAQKFKYSFIISDDQKEELLKALASADTQKLEKFRTLADKITQLEKLVLARLSADNPNFFENLKNMAGQLIQKNQDASHEIQKEHKQKIQAQEAALRAEEERLLEDIESEIESLDL